jgi:Ca2+/Na+ antiporter
LTVMKPEAPHMSAPSKQTKGVGSMRHQNKIKIQRRRRRKFFWLFAAAAVSALMFGEQVALLYVLSTLALCGPLIVVAFSNLEAKDAEMQAAAIREAADDMSTKSRDLRREERRAA